MPALKKAQKQAQVKIQEVKKKVGLIFRSSFLPRLFLNYAILKKENIK